MRLKLLVGFMILIFSLGGCNNLESNTYPLDFTEVSNVKIKDMQFNSIDKIIQEKRINSENNIFLYNDKENCQISIGINLKDKLYHIGEVSIENTPNQLMGIEEVQVFGKKAVKISGIMGANYSNAYYCFIEDNLEESIIQVDGNTLEIDLDENGKNEIISTMGTVPETRIYILKEDKIYFSNINESIGAEAVILQDKDKKLFQVYFEPNKTEQYIYYKESFLRR